jgi:hypothetical protein
MTSTATVESSFDAMAIVQEMIVCLNNADEPKIVADIREKQAELRRLHDKQQQELKDIVSGMNIFSIF